MSEQGGFKGRCSNCGWTTRRHLKNMKRPCPKCGGAIVVDEEDKGAAIVYVVAFIVIGLIVAVIMETVRAGN